MKRFYKNTKNKLIVTLILGLLSFPLWGSPIAVVNTVKGHVFVSLNGKTDVLKPGDYIEDFSEIVTEEGAQITFSDYFDHRYHLAGSGHVKMLNKIVELKRGYMWMQSFREDELFSLQTANAKVAYKGGEAIISLDIATGKTQILTVKGQFEFSNLLQPQYVTEVLPGQFSFIADDYSAGAPRNPTFIGETSYNKVTSLFDGFTSKKEKKIVAVKKPARVAVVPELKPVVEEVKRFEAGTDELLPGETTIIRAPASIDSKFNVNNFYQKKVKKVKKRVIKKKFAPDYSQKSNVPIKIYGTTSYTAKKLAPKVLKAIPKAPPKALPKPKVAKTFEKEAPKVKSTPKRLPASVAPVVVKPMKSNGQFEESLTDEYKKQMRHSKEVNKLIDDLKSFDQDYSQSY